MENVFTNLKTKLVVVSLVLFSLLSMTAINASASSSSFSHYDYNNDVNNVIVSSLSTTNKNTVSAYTNIINNNGKSYYFALIRDGVVIKRVDGTLNSNNKSFTLTDTSAYKNAEYVLNVVVDGKIIERKVYNFKYS